MQSNVVIFINIITDHGVCIEGHNNPRNTEVSNRKRNNEEVCNVLKSPLLINNFQIQCVSKKTPLQKQIYQNISGHSGQILAFFAILGNSGHSGKFWSFWAILGILGKQNIIKGCQDQSALLLRWSCARDNDENSWSKQESQIVIGIQGFITKLAAAADKASLA